jgi:hypothetical protein
MHDPVGSAFGAGRGGAAAGPQVGAGAEPVPGGGQDHRPDLHLGARRLEELDDALALVRGDGVAHLGPVERDPRHPVLDAMEHLLL